MISLVELGDEGLRAVIEAEDAAVAVSVVTLGELHHGVLAATSPAKSDVRRRTYAAALTMNVIPVREDQAAAYGEISAVLPRRIGSNDRWIAATAKHHDLTLVTYDSDLRAAIARIPPASRPRVMRFTHPPKFN